MSNPVSTPALLLPVAVINDKVFFPHTQAAFDIPLNASASAFQNAMANGKFIFLSLARQQEQPNTQSFYTLGTVAKVLELHKREGFDICAVKVEILYRAELTEILGESPHIYAKILRREEENDLTPLEEVSFARVLRKKAGMYSNAVRGLPRDFFEKACRIRSVAKLTDYIISYVYCDAGLKQDFLWNFNVRRRASELIAFLQSELNSLQLEQEIEGKLKLRMDKNQRDYQLREKMNVIAKELGEEESARQELERYRERIAELAFAPEIEEKLLRECNRLSKLQFSSAEAGVLRTYLDTCLGLPWGVQTEERLDVKRAAKQLDKDHYGMEKVKERILEMIAVRKLAPDITGQILCLAGPPGVGKTSIAKSVAAALNRSFVRIALGGVHDEAELRGHRKTYIGSMPGRIIDAIKQAGSTNPLILLDEVDKLGSDYKGDPSSALLEVLDGEQNSTFTDHYLDIPFDLSKVLFITTANDAYAIPAPLLDRMEIITLPSYTIEEKLSIAKRHLIKKQLKRHGLSSEQLKITDKAIKEIIEGYTLEAGVRNLERKLASVCRKTAKSIVEGEAESIRLTPATVKELLGARKFKPESKAKKPLVGVVNGLAWTSAGGTLLEIEASAIKGSGKLQLTGNLGDVMRESAMAAITFVRSRAEEYGIDPSFYENTDIHIHAPEGAIPKDGPSAGITMATAIVSALTGIPVRNDVAMTGEISLRGRVMPIGGLREKSMAAYMNGIKRVIIPSENLPDLEEASQTVRSSLEFIPAEYADTAIEKALITAPVRSRVIQLECSDTAIAASAPLCTDNIIPKDAGELSENGNSTV
ncbi:MAG: endopeptidase La [Oscillospiraceae bacterium]|jgi:ATP-dependent Lon protease|nr:endopeptidase La [Oscillospiraceae bacterium]